MHTAARTRCGSGLQGSAVRRGQVATGAASVAVAGGAESMSNVEHYAVGLRSSACAKGPLRVERVVGLAEEDASTTVAHTAAPVGVTLIDPRLTWPEVTYKAFRQQ